MSPTTALVARKSAQLIAAMGLLAGCGGGAGGGAVQAPVTPATTPPPATPAPPPTTGSAPRSPNESAALVDPVQTVFPASPIAVLNGSSLAKPAASTVFPVLQTAATRSFAGDASTTSQGASLILDGGTAKLYWTFNNETLQVANVAATADRTTLGPWTAFGAPLPGERNLQTLLYRLDHALHGYWLVQGLSGTLTFAAGGGAWAAGYITPPGAIRDTGSARYSGRILGLYDEGFDSVALLNGTAAVTMDFTTRVVTGVLSQVGLGSDNFIHGPLNDFRFDAILDRSSNLFIGTIRPLTAPTNGSAFATEGTGTITGRLYGPQSDEVAAVWTLSDGTRRMIGSFAARQ